MPEFGLKALVSEHAVSHPFPQPCLVLEERRRKKETQQQDFGIPVSPGCHPGPGRCPSLTLCARETNHRGAHTLTPRREWK